MKCRNSCLGFELGHKTEVVLYWKAMYLRLFVVMGLTQSLVEIERRTRSPSLQTCVLTSLPKPTDLPVSFKTSLHYKLSKLLHVLSTAERED